MPSFNAIEKVRFNSARPQRVQLYRCDPFACDLLCLEPEQEFVLTGPAACYVITGDGSLQVAKRAEDLRMCHFASSDAGESHTVVNSSEQRLVLLMVSQHA